MGKPRKLKLRQILGANVRRGRIALGWSQEKLAQEADLSQRYISEVESAIFAATVDKIEQLANALNIHPDLLLRAD